MIPRKKSTITPLAIHMMRMFCFSSSPWSVIDSSFSDDTTELQKMRRPQRGARCAEALPFELVCFSTGAVIVCR
jgi:hypothetical protein